MITLAKFFDFLFLEECLGCRKPGKLLCENCLLEIKYSREKDLDLKNFSKNKDYLKLVAWVHSPLNYQNPTLRKALFALKYTYVKTVAKYLATIVYQDFFSFLKKHYPHLLRNSGRLLLIPIPISKKRLLKRNYNQSEVLLQELMKILLEKMKLDLRENLSPHILLKTKHTLPFANSHSIEERNNLIKDAFSVNQIPSVNFLQDKIIILFDDITTTGATFYEARKTLVEAGARQENIFAFALAH